MHYSLSNALGRPYAGILDQDATNYIAAVTAAGATVTSTQKYAINDFILAEKAASRWTGLKRFYLPIWGVAAANAICMKSLTSGTFVGGVTHAAGYVQGNGSTGYFTANGTGTTMGVSVSDLHFGCLAKTGGTVDLTTMVDFSIGDYNTLIWSTGANGIYVCINDTFDFTPTGSKETGVVVCDLSGVNREYGIRDSTGYSALATNTNARYSNTLSVVATELVVWKTNDIGGFGNFQMGALWAATSRQAELSAFTLNVKTLWETVTNLTLP